MAHFARVWAALAVAALLAWPAHAEDAALSIGGAVEHPGRFGVDELKALPRATETVFFHTGHGPVQAVFAGVPLWSLLDKVGIKADPKVRNDMLRRYLVATGNDGYTVVLALAEIVPEFGGQQVIVAFEQDGKPIEGGVRLIVPGDKGGGRDVLRLKAIELRDAPPATSQP
jgi:DMSO/TMAO reductase YedYZ molybdopterin-dependent catalytic subunit